MHGLDNAISLIFLLNSPLTEGETKNAPSPSKDIRHNSDTNVAVNVTTSHLLLHILQYFTSLISSGFVCYLSHFFDFFLMTDFATSFHHSFDQEVEND